MRIFCGTVRAMQAVALCCVVLLCFVSSSVSGMCLVVCRCVLFNVASSATHTHMQAVAAAVHHREPVLLAGETGTGKTSLVQHLASCVGAHMVVVNLNQQSDSGDLLGGFKPVEVRQLAQELMDDLMELLPRVTVGNSQKSVGCWICVV